MKTKRTDVLKKKLSKNGKFYFVRVAANGETVFRSEMYSHRQGNNRAVKRITDKENLKVIPIKSSIR